MAGFVFNMFSIFKNAFIGLAAFIGSVFGFDNNSPVETLAVTPMPTSIIEELPTPTPKIIYATATPKPTKTQTAEEKYHELLNQVNKSKEQFFNNTPTPSPAFTPFPVSPPTPLIIYVTPIPTPIQTPIIIFVTPPPTSVPTPTPYAGLWITKFTVNNDSPFYSETVEFSWETLNAEVCTITGANNAGEYSLFKQYVEVLDLPPMGKLVRQASRISYKADYKVAMLWCADRFHNIVFMSTPFDVLPDPTPTP